MDIERSSPFLEKSISAVCSGNASYCTVGFEFMLVTAANRLLSLTSRGDSEVRAR
jgi:hypothetical protein